MPNGEAAVEGDRRRPRVPDDVPGGLRPRAELRRHRRARSPRSSARWSSSTRRSTASSPATRARSPTRRSAGWVLFNGKARCVTCHPINARRTRSAPTTASTTSASSARHQDFEELAQQGAGRAREGRRSKKRIDELALETDLSRARPLPGHASNRADIGAFKTLAAAQHRHHRAVHARRLDADAVGRDGPLQQGRRGEPVPRRRHRAARADRGARSTQLVAFMFTLTDERFAAQNNARARRASSALAAKQRPFRDDALAHAQGAAVRARALGRPAAKEDEPMSRTHQEHRDQAHARSATRSSRRCATLDRRDFLKVSRGRGRRRGGERRRLHARTRSSRSRSRTRAGDRQARFRFAYISDSHLYERDAQRPLRARAAARGRRRQRAGPAARLRALRRRPRAARPAGGARARRADPEERSRRRVRMMVGEHDWYLDMGEKWRELFGEPTLLVRPQGRALRRAEERRSRRTSGPRASMTPMERMQTVAGLDNGMQSRVRGRRRAARVARRTTSRRCRRRRRSIVFSHSPLYKLLQDLELLDRRRRRGAGDPASASSSVDRDPRPHAPAAHQPHRQHPLPRHAVDRVAVAVRAARACRSSPCR